MHIDGLLNYDAAHGFHLPNGTRHENTVRKPSDIAGQHHLNIYEAEMFQCLRVEQWSVLEAVTVPCTRNIFMHLTSFPEISYNTSIRHRRVPRMAWKFPSLERSGPNLRRNSWTETLVILCVCGQHWKLASHEKILFGIHLSNTDRWEGGHTPSKLFVDTKVWGHGWRKRNATITGLHCFKIPTCLARCEISCIQN